MTTQNDKIFSGPPIGTRQGDGGIYLIVVDDSDEFTVAKNYACSLAQTRRGHVAIAHITQLDEFVHWGNVEAMMRHDMRKNAEETLWNIAKSINEEYGLFPSLYIREGETVDEIIDIINEEKNIRSLILGASTSLNNPQPLINYFSGKGMERLRIPMVVVPGHLDKEAIRSITKGNPSQKG